MVCTCCGVVGADARPNWGEIRADERLSDLSISASHDRTLAQRSNAPQSAAPINVDPNEDGRSPDYVRVPSPIRARFAFGSRQSPHAIAGWLLLRFDIEFASSRVLGFVSGKRLDEMAGVDPF